MRAFLFGTLLLVACGKPQVCVPGASVACTGPAGCSGGQVCSAAGDGFGACVCGSGGGGGSGGGSGGDSGVVLELRVKWVATGCAGAPNPLSGATQLKLHVDGTPPVDLTPAVGTTMATVPTPSGGVRTVELRALDASGAVIAYGRSLPTAVTGPTDVTLLMRRTGAFTSGSCLAMTRARAGHTATLLPSGKVFLAGGYSFPDGGAEPVATNETELFDPATNGFTAGAPMALSGSGTGFPRAFQSVTALPNGQLLLWGGENYNAGTPVSSSLILLFDEDANAYGALPARTNPPAIARSRHQAAIDGNGKVLIAGGRPDQVEWFNPTVNATGVVVNFTRPQIGGSISASPDGGRVVIAGGMDAGTEAGFFVWNNTNSTFERQPSAPVPMLAAPRNAPAVVVLGDGWLIAGGNGGTATERLSDVSLQVSAGPALAEAVSAPCAVRLPNGNVFLSGGLATDHSVAATAEVRPTGSDVLTQPLPAARHEHTCTLLPNGTVLITGGRSQTALGATVLNDALVYQPLVPP